MTYDTIETAFSKAREAQRRGTHTIQLLLPAGRNTMALRLDIASVLTEGKDGGSVGLVVRRLKGPEYRDDEAGIRLPGKVETLVVQASVTDILDLARRSVERDLRPLSPVKRTVRRRSLAHLMTR